jgi:ABC-type lipoprotein release transport system permease subunit
MGMAAVLLVARSEWRSRWRSHIVIAVLVTLTVGVTVATLTGASRSESAFYRLRAETNASDIAVYMGGAEDGLRDARAALASTDGVLDTDVAVELFLRPAGTDYFPDYQLLAVAPMEAPGSDGLDRPVIVAGRAVDPTHANEVALSERLAHELGAEVGDVVPLESMTNEWIELSLNGGNPGAPDGPKVDATVVGIARSPADFSRLRALLYLSPAFVERYGDDMRTYTLLRAQVTPAALRAAVAGEGLGDLGGDEVRPSPFIDDASTEDGLGTIAGALRIVAAAAALAGAVAIALGSVRASRAALLDGAALRAVGFTRGQQVQAALVILLPWLAAGVVAGVVAGVLASPVALRGLARAADPSPDAVDVNVAVIVAVAGAALLAGVALLLLAGRLATARRTSQARVAPRLFTLRRPLPAVIGARDALFGSANRGGWTSRAALGVGALGVAAAVGALMVSASISRLQIDPRLSGQTQAPVIDSGETIDKYDEALALLERDERVAVLAGIHVLFDIEVDGRGGTNTVAIDLHRGDIGASLIAGRIPSGRDEVALGPATLERIGKNVGDRVTLRGGTGESEVDIVGSMLFPEGDFSHDEGIAITAEAAGRLVGDVRSGGLHQVLFDWRDGVDATAANQDLRNLGFNVLTNDTAVQPATVTNLGEVVELPRFLAAFVALLALVTLVHALAVALRSRSAELATMRALGMTARGTAGVLSTHVAVLAGAALVAGLPLGLVIGRIVWRPIAENAHVIVLAVWPSESIAYVVGIGVLATGLLAAIAAWRVVRLHPIELLRTE